MGVDDEIARALCARDAEVLRLRAALEEAHVAVAIVMAQCFERGERENAEVWLGVWKRVQEALSTGDSSMPTP